MPREGHEKEGTVTSQEHGDQAWFEGVYAAAGNDAGRISWADMEVNPYVDEWLRAQARVGESAVVIGCGLGDDAEAVAAQGYRVTAFDVSATAIAWCQQRFPTSPVTYVVADLFALPADWQFDLVVEVYTVQALPVEARQTVVRAIARLVKAGGTLVVVGRLAESAAQQVQRPWPLTRDELGWFEAAGLRLKTMETFADAGISGLGLVRFRAVYER